MTMGEILGRSFELAVDYKFEGRPKTSFLSPYRDLPASHRGRGYRKFSHDQGERSRALI